MAKIDVNEIEKKLEELKREYNQAINEWNDFIGLQDIQPEEENYDPMYDEGVFLQNQVNTLSECIERLEGYKNIKIEGDEYIKLYPKGYNCSINKQTDFQVEDKLARTKEAEVIANKIAGKEVKTVGIFGEWGTGKSTFLGFVDDELKKRNIETVKIDASEHSDQEKIWAYIYSKISEKFNRKPRRKCKFLLSNIKKNWFYILLNLIISIGIVIFVAYPTTRGIIEYFIKNNENEILSMCADKAIAIMFIYVYIRYIFPKIVEINSGLKHFSHWFRNNMFTPNQDQVLGYKVEVKNNLDNMMDLWGETIVLLIDELDRCSEDVLVRFFDTMQLFQHSERIQIVYAVDRRSLHRALENKKIPREELDSYLKKYIDYGINLYSINRDAYCLDNIIKQYEFTRTEFTYIYTYIQKHLQINITIRDLKEILNILCEIKKDWLDKYIFTKKYEDNDNYVVSFKKFIPWAIEALAGTKWIPYMLEDIPSLTEIKQGNYEDKKFDYIIATEELRTKYRECPKYLKETKIIDIIYYRELVKKYKEV